MKQMLRVVHIIATHKYLQNYFVLSGGGECLNLDNAHRHRPTDRLVCCLIQHDMIACFAIRPCDVLPAYHRRAIFAFAHVYNW